MVHLFKHVYPLHEHTNNLFWLADTRSMAGVDFLHNPLQPTSLHKHVLDRRRQCCVFRALQKRKLTLKSLFCPSWGLCGSL